jgi:hypothetical protein
VSATLFPQDVSANVDTRTGQAVAGVEGSRPEVGARGEEPERTESATISRAVALRRMRFAGSAGEKVESGENASPVPTDRLLIPVEIRPHVRAALGTRASELPFNVREPHIIRPLIRTERLRVTAPVISAIDHDGSSQRLFWSVGPCLRYN